MNNHRKQIISKSDYINIINNYCEQFDYQLVDEIGKGSYGKAYKILDENKNFKVVKLTCDLSEVDAATKLSKKPTSKHIINYYDIRKISEYNQYLILMDYVKNIEEIKKENEILYYTLLSITRKYGNIKKIKNFKNHVYNYTIEFLEFHLKQKPSDEIKELVENYIEKYLNEIDDLIKELNKYKIDFDKTDFHEGNIGLDENDHLVFFDISYGNDGLKLKNIKHYLESKEND